MVNNNWIGGSGAKDWNDITNWSLGVAPVSTNNVFILQGDSDIQTNLSHAAVVLDSLTIGGSFNGTIASDANAQTASPLAIGIATGGLVTVNCASQRLWFDFGTSVPVIVVTQTGQPAISSFGGESLQIRGCAGAATLSVSGSCSVGVATTLPGLTSTIASWSIESGTLNVGPGVTWTNGYQSGGTASIYSGGTLIQQSGTAGILNTFGTAKVATLNITGSAIISNRPAAGTDAFDTLNLGPGATGDVSQDPRPLTITTGITLQKEAVFRAFTPGQINSAGTFQVKWVLCDVSEATLSLGSNAVGTFTGY